MANSITTLVPKIIAGRSLEFLRENAVTPRLVQNISDKVVAQKGDVITLPDTDALTVTNVTVAATPPLPADVTLASKYVTINQWKKVSFGLTDKELHEIAAGEHFVPGEMQEAMRALGNNVDDYILALYTGVWNFAGTPGTTPFATNLNAFRDARKLLNKDLAPMSGRNVVLDPDAEANALVLSQFLKADERGDQGGIISGEIGTKLGANWYMNQNVVSAHTVGSWGCAASCGTEVKAVATAGTSTFIIQGTSTTTTIGGSVKAGDVFYVTGDSQPYVVKTGGSVAAAAGATLALTVSPPFRATIGAAATVAWYQSTIAKTDLLDVGDPSVNLYFHPNAIAFCSRPMASTSSFLGSGGNFTQVVRDPVTGISMRMEIIRQYKRWSVEYDILYGATLVRPQLAARIHG